MIMILVIITSLSIIYQSISFSYSYITLSKISRCNSTPYKTIVKTFKTFPNSETKFFSTASIEPNYLSNLPLSLSPPNYLLEIIDGRLGKDLTESEVAVLGGVSLSAAKQDLMQLATLTDAIIKVTRSGEVIYIFPQNYRSLLLSRSAKARAYFLFQQISKPLYEAFKASFGIALAASIMILVTSQFIIVIFGSSTKSFESSDSSDNRSSSNRAYNSYSSFYFDFNQPLRISSPNDIPMFSNAFTYLFGDPDPNQGLSTEYSKKIAEIISKSQGVVTGEQLLPYYEQPPKFESTDDAAPLDPASTSSIIVDESWMIPVLTKYNGRPVVTDSGDIVYIFEELLPNEPMSEDAVKRNKQQLIKYDDREYREKEIPFLPQRFVDSNSHLLPAALGVLNLVLAYNVGGFLTKLNVHTITLKGFEHFLPWMNRLFPFLATYAVAYNVIPIVRYFVNKSKNEKISTRNRIRDQWAQLLKNMSPALKRKMDSKQRYVEQILDSKKESLMKKENEIIYDSSKSMNEQFN